MYLHVIKCVLSVPAVVGHRFMSLYTRPDRWEPLDYAGGGPVKKVKNRYRTRRETSLLTDIFNATNRIYNAANRIHNAVNSIPNNAVDRYL